MNDLVVVSTFLHRHEAEAAKGLLESEGIKSMLSADDCGGMRPGMSFGSAIILSVANSELDRARQILDQK